MKVNDRNRITYERVVARDGGPQDIVYEFNLLKMGLDPSGFMKSGWICNIFWVIGGIMSLEGQLILDEDN